MNYTNCLNCGQPLEPHNNFCAECGQNAHLHRLNFHDLGHDAIHFLTHADKSIFSLLKQLLSRPGYVAREYFGGKRKKYFNPLNYFLIVAGIVVFMTSLFYSPSDLRSKQMEQSAQNIAEPVKKQKLLDMSTRMKHVNRVTGKYSNFINMLATPLLSFFFWIFYRKQYNYVEGLVANMYIIGVIMLVYSLVIVPLQHFLPKQGTLLITIFFLIEIGYQGLAYYQLSSKKGTVAVIKAYGVSLLLSLFWIAFTYLIIVNYIRTGFKIS